MIFLRLPDVISRTGLSRSGIYKRIAEGNFPIPVKLGERAIAWPETEVMAWQESRPRAARPMTGEPVAPGPRKAA